MGRSYKAMSMIEVTLYWVPVQQVDILHWPNARELHISASSVKPLSRLGCLLFSLKYEALILLYYIYLIVTVEETECPVKN